MDYIHGTRTAGEYYKNFLRDKPKCVENLGCLRIMIGRAERSLEVLPFASGSAYSTITPHWGVDIE